MTAVKAGSEILMTAYRHVRNVVNKQNKTLKRQYFTEKIRRCEGDMKETWKTINQLVNKRSKTTNVSSLQDDNKILTSSDEIAESMNQYFCNIYFLFLILYTPRPFSNKITLAKKHKSNYNHC